MNDSGPPNPTKRFIVTLPAETQEKLCALAKSEKRGIEDLLAELVKEGLRAHELERKQLEELAERFDHLRREPGLASMNSRFARMILGK